jgi:hypothetical protein
MIPVIFLANIQVFSFVKIAWISEQFALVNLLTHFSLPSLPLSILRDLLLLSSDLTYLEYLLAYQLV